MKIVWWSKILACPQSVRLPYPADWTYRWSRATWELKIHCNYIRWFERKHVKDFQSCNSWCWQKGLRVLGKNRYFRFYFFLTWKMECTHSTQRLKLTGKRIGQSFAKKETCKQNTTHRCTIRKPCAPIKENNFYYSRTPVTRTLKGNKKQFELTGFRVIGVDWIRSERDNNELSIYYPLKMLWT